MLGQNPAHSSKVRIDPLSVHAREPGNTAHALGPDGWQPGRPKGRFGGLGRNERLTPAWPRRLAPLARMVNALASAVTGDRAGSQSDRRMSNGLREWDRLGLQREGPATMESSTWTLRPDDRRQHATQAKVYWTVVGAMVGSLLFQITAPLTWVDDVAARALAAVCAAGLGAYVGLLVGRVSGRSGR